MCRPTPFAALFAAALLGCAAGRRPEASPPVLPPARFDWAGPHMNGLFIWDMHPVESVTLKQAVGDALQEFGFQRSFDGGMDFLVNVQAFASDKDPGRLTIVVECLDPSLRRRLWIGQADLREGHRTLDLKDFLAALLHDRGFRRFLAKARESRASIPA